MTSRRLLAALLFASPALALGSPAGSPQAVNAYLTAEDGKSSKVPLFAPASAAVPVARVEGEVVTLGELSKVLATAHAGFKDIGSEGKAGKKDFAPVLDRLVNTRLFILEARAMGIADLPEVKTAVAQFREESLREAVKRKTIAAVHPDQMIVESAYRESVKEWKVKSVLFTAEADAKAMKAAVAAGKSFDDLAKKAVADKKAQGGEPAEFLPRKQLLPQVLEAAQRLEVGGVSDPVKVDKGFAILKVEAVRFPDNPKARQELEQASLKAEQERALAKSYSALSKKYVKIDKPLLDKIDFEAAKPGFKALEKDQRVLARVAGEKPVTVGDLAKALREQFFHGLDSALREKKVNGLKASTLDGLLSPRIVLLEARRQGLDKSPAYRRQVEDYERSAVFGVFMAKTILPSIKVTDEDKKKFYEQHKKEFSYPAMYKLESLAFRDVKDAQAALTKLRGGTDYRWLKANAERQVPDDRMNPVFDGSTLSAATLPADLAEQLAGTKKNDYRLYAAPSAQYHVLHVIDAVPSGTQPYAEVQEPVGKAVYNEHVEAALNDYARKLRQAHAVKVYLTRIGA